MPLHNPGPNGLAPVWTDTQDEPPPRMICADARPMARATEGGDDE